MAIRGKLMRRVRGVASGQWRRCKRYGIRFGAVALCGIATLMFALSTSFPLSLCALALTGAFNLVFPALRHREKLG
jgi:transposase InsO family protein